MKKPMGSFIEQFKFTENQRSELLKAWSRKQSHEDANKFLDIAEDRIELWFGIYGEEDKTIPEKREYANDLLKHTKALIDVFNKLPESLIISIDGMMTERLYLSTYKFETYQAREFLKAVTSHPDNRHMKGGNYPSFEEMVEILEPFLHAISDVAKEITEWKSPPGQDKGREKLLIQWLADSFSIVFKKAPSSSNGSIFRKFSERLSSEIDVHLGANIVCEILENRDYSVLNISKT